MNEVRALAVVSDEGKPADVVSGNYPERSEKLLGYLTKEGGVRGDSTLSLLLRPAGDTKLKGLVTLFGVTVQLTGDEMDGTKICLLLPENARGYTDYRVMPVSREGVPAGDAVNVRMEGDSILFETDGNTDFLIFAQRKVDLVWLIVLLGCLCGLETAALLYIVGYLMKNRTAAFAPVLLATVIVPASAIPVCTALGAVCLAEGIAIGVLLARIRRRESPRDKKR